VKVKVMTRPDRGQGLNHCIRDAALLLSALISAKYNNETLAEAIKEYEEEMIPRAMAEVKSSVENTELIVDWNRLMDSPIMMFGSARTS
jgi:2-polyprenyl-6-methoxyphenol hydroxylase-like FAD-dependent oxidoreductase